MTSQQHDVIHGLNPADYFTLAMDSEIRSEGLPGSLCGFALELDSLPDDRQLECRITMFCDRFPTSRARLKKIGRHYYWYKRSRPKRIFHRHVCPDHDQRQQSFKSCIDAIMAEQQPIETGNPLEFHLISGTGRAVFLIRWLHPFCDARGAELIVRYICGADLSPDEKERTITTSMVNAQLEKYSLWQRLKLFRKAKQLIESIDQSESIVVVDVSNPPAALDFTVHRFSIEETRIVGEQIKNNVGLAGTSLYYIGCFMRVLESLYPAAIGDSYCVPYAFNLRKQNASHPVTGNHVSFLFAHANRMHVNSREKLFHTLRQQYRDSIRQQLDYAFIPLMALARWLSLPRYGRILRQSFQSGNERSSFWFSDLGVLDFHGLSCSGAKVTGVFQLCHISTPPALGFFSCIFEKQLTLTYIYNRPQIDAEAIEQLHAAMRNELLGERA